MRVWLFMLDAMLQYLHFCARVIRSGRGNRYFNVWSNTIYILKKITFFVNQWFKRHHAITLKNDDQQDNKTVKNST